MECLDLYASHVIIMVKFGKKYLFKPVLKHVEFVKIVFL